MKICKKNDATFCTKFFLYFFILFHSWFGFNNLFNGFCFACFFKRFVKIVFPLSKGGFISGFMLIFVSIMKELDLIILIMTPKTSTLPYLAFQYQNQNCPQASNCVAIVMFSIVFLVYALANIFGDADLAKSMAG